LVSVDVADGLPVTLDSYAKEDGSRKTEYGRYIKHDNKEIGFERVIRYNDGISSDQVMASGCYPVNFDYASLEVESYYEPINKNNNPDSFLRSNSENSSNGNSSRAGASTPPDRVFREHYIKETRYFWDGGMMSNTPLSQLILLHRNYWYKARGLKDKVPTLDTCVINVHPTRQKEIPTDHDGVVNRNYDITFSDRSHKEEEVLLLISDYVDLVRDLIRIARDNGVKDKVIDNLLNQRTKYHGLSLRPRLNKDIVEGRFDISEIIRIERKNDEHTISDKTFDFSSGTIRHLLNNGYKDTIDYINTRTN
jgi:hypothetical protein